MKISLDFVDRLHFDPNFSGNTCEEPKFFCGLLKKLALLELCKPSKECGKSRANASQFIKLISPHR